MTGALRVGLIGAGPWATAVHAPGLATHAHTELTGVWARRSEAAQALADAHGAKMCADVDELLQHVDAVALAVPPAVQAELGERAAAAGKHLILEKPIAADIAGARKLAKTVAEHGVAALVMLRLRYADTTRRWLDEAAEAGGWAGGSVRWLSGALLSDTYGGSAWRHEGGALADVGPHVLDLLDAALGEITEVLGAHRVDDDLWHLVLAHAGGATSTVTMSMRLPMRPTVVEFAIYGKHGFRTLSRAPDTALAGYTTLLDDLLTMIDTGRRTHPCDVRRGLHLQHVLDAVLKAL